MRKSIIQTTIIALLSLLVLGCSSDLAPANAEVIKIEVKEATGKVGGIIKAASPGTAGMGTKNLDFEAPGSLEVKGGPSEYTITFNALPKAMRQNLEISVDGRVLKRGADMVWEDDKGPRITFTTQGKKAE